MGRIGRIAVVLVLLGCSNVVAQPVTPSAADELKLADGFASREDAVARFVAALQANEKDALMALLLSPEVYRDLIIPGTVEPGQPLRTWPEKPRQFFTDDFFHKSSLYADVLLKDWGGRKLTLKKFWFTRPPKTYATYEAYGELRVEVDADPPIEGDREPVIRTGFLAKVGDSWKFIGFLHDDD